MHKVLHSSKKHDYRTPNVVLDLVRKVDDIILDPCANKHEKNWFAKHNITAEVNGLSIVWADFIEQTIDESGITFVNPPYGRALPVWVNKIVDEANLGVEVILLCPARPDTKWWNMLWDNANAYCFWRGRIKFVGEEQGAGFPSALIYWGMKTKKFCRVFSPVGITGLI
jgi:site-specific DNA-methyltransferase (adenine-specific)